MRLEGGCLCGKVRYHSNEEPVAVGHCYCEDCRRSSGTAHCTHVALPDGGFQAAGDVRFFERPSNAGNMVRRGFCPICGSALYSTNEATPGLVYIRASSLDDPNAIAPQMSVFACRAPVWDLPPQDMPVFDTMPPPPSIMEA